MFALYKHLYICMYVIGREIKSERKNEEIILINYKFGLWTPKKEV